MPERHLWRIPHRQGGCYGIGFAEHGFHHGGFFLSGGEEDDVFDPLEQGRGDGNTVGTGIAKYGRGVTVRGAGLYLFRREQ